MLKWYRNLYTGENAKKNLGEIIGKLNDSIPVRNVYLITYATSPHNQLDIINSFYLFQKTVERRIPEVVGIACGKTEAFDLIEKIAREAVDATGKADLKTYLMEKK